MGDVVTLVEKAQQDLSDEKIKEQNKKIKVIDYSKLKDIGKKLKNKRL